MYTLTSRSTESYALRMYRSRGRARLVRLRVVGPRRRPRGELLVRCQRVGTLQRVLRRQARWRVRVLQWRPVHVVAVVRVPHALHHLPAQRVRRRHALLFLPPIAEPHAHYLLLQLQAVRQRRYLLCRRFRLLVEVLF